MLKPGRSCPNDYRITPEDFQEYDIGTADTVYIVGGLYGNFEALKTIKKMAQEENAAVIFNGDMHWFDAELKIFSEIENEIAKYLCLRGNIEAELARGSQIGAGCGCAYPMDVDDGTVERSNAIFSRLYSILDNNSQMREKMAIKPRAAVVNIGGSRIGITHGDEHLLGGWGCCRQILKKKNRQSELNDFMQRNRLTVFAVTHTCAPAALEMKDGVVINNGAAGMPNFAGEQCGLISRISIKQEKSAIYRCSRNGLFIEAVPVYYDNNSFLTWFDKVWTEGSPAAVSYRQRIVGGTKDNPFDAILGGFYLLNNS